MTVLVRPRVFVTQPIAAGALDRLRGFADVTVNPDSSRILPREALLAGVLDCDFLLSLMHDKIDGAIIAANPNLRAIASMAVTPSDIDVDEATRRGVIVTTAPPIVTEAAADICFGLLIAVARRIVEGDQLVRQGVFPGGQSNHLLGSGVWGKTLVVTPHLGSAVPETRNALANAVADNLLAVIEGRRPPNIVNPEVLSGWTSHRARMGAKAN
jgi:glyoxylate reductase